MNKPAYIVSDDKITVVHNGTPYTVAVDNPNYKGLRSALIKAEYDKVPNFLSTQQRVADFTKGNIEIRNEELFYRGRKLHGVVVDKLFSLLREGLADAQPLLNFIERLTANPSSNSTEQLYTFLSYRELPITPEGRVLAYKGVEADYYSRKGNKNTVVVQGVVDSAGRVRNRVGDVVEVQRSSVDDNRDNHCSHGLHVGSYDYARDWAGNEGHLMLVSFDPADAVSVPTDCSFQKCRVSKYKVESEIPQDKRAPIRRSCVEPENAYDDDDNSPDEDEDVLPNNPYRDSTVLAIKNYVENKLDQNVEPTLKQIQSRLKGIHITCEEIANICENQLGFTVEDDDDAYSNSVVYES